MEEKNKKTTTQKNEIPIVLTSNTYYWNPGANSKSRKTNELKHINKVREFLIALGFDITNDNYNDVMAKKENVEVYFLYWESCNNVYKKLEVKVNGKRSNIRTIKKMNTKSNE